MGVSLQSDTRNIGTDGHTPSCMDVGSGGQEYVISKKKNYSKQKLTIKTAREICILNYRRTLLASTN